MTGSFRSSRAGSVASQVSLVVAVAVMNVVVVRVWGAAARGDLALLVTAATLSATAGGLGVQDVLVWSRSANGGAHVPALFRRSLVIVALASVVGVVALARLRPLDVAWGVLPAAMCIHWARVANGARLADGQLPRFNAERVLFPTFAAAGVTGAAIAKLAHPSSGYVAGAAAAAFVLARPALALLRRPGDSTKAGADLVRRVARQSATGNLVTASLSRLDLFVVGWLASSSELGRYSVALAAAEISLTAAYGLSFHALREGAISGAASGRTVRQSLLATGALTLVTTVGLFGLAEPIFGPGFQDLGWIYLLLAPGITSMAYVRIKFSGALTAGRGRTETIALVAATVVMLALDLVLIPRLGTAGAAVASSVAYVAAAIGISLRGSHR